MAYVISTINLKGGVGKTTTTIALAETLAAGFGKRVLVIDLDPQTNATLMMIGEEKWCALNAQDRTVARLFKDALDPSDKKFDLGATVQKGASDVAGAETVDLIPSSLDLIDIQDKLYCAPPGIFGPVSPTDLLRPAVRPALKNYDVVLIDCPPSLGIVTLNGLRVSQGYIIPTIADYLSTYGIPQIVRRVAKFSQEIGEPISPLGIIVNKFQVNSTIQVKELTRLTNDWKYKKKDAPLFETVIKQSNIVADAAKCTEYKRTLKEKYNQFADRFLELAQELLAKIEESADVAA
jgi:chromosome partitioning protein